MVHQLEKVEDNVESLMTLLRGLRDLDRLTSLEARAMSVIETLQARIAGSAARERLEQCACAKDAALILDRCPRCKRDDWALFT